MFRDIEVENLASSMLDDKKAVQDSKSYCGHREEVHGHNHLAVVAQKGGPEFPGLV
jgi:hypothetical protein